VFIPNLPPEINLTLLLVIEYQRLNLLFVLVQQQVSGSDTSQPLESDS
jgi:hypothetical protein